MSLGERTFDCAAQHKETFSRDFPTAFAPPTSAFRLQVPGRTNVIDISTMKGQLKLDIRVLSATHLMVQFLEYFMAVHHCSLFIYNVFLFNWFTGRLGVVKLR